MKLQSLFVPLTLIFLLFFTMCCLHASILHAKDPTYKWKLATFAPDGVEWSIFIKEQKCILVWNEFAGKTFPEKLLNDVLLYLNEFRAKDM